MRKHKWSKYHVSLNTSGKMLQSFPVPLHSSSQCGEGWKMLLSQRPGKLLQVWCNNERWTWDLIHTDTHWISASFLWHLWHSRLRHTNKAKLKLQIILLQFPHDKRNCSISIMLFCSKQCDVVGTTKLWQIQNQPTPGGALTWTNVSTHSSFWSYYTYFLSTVYQQLMYSFYSHFQTPPHSSYKY
jgi:hypothetical protein